MQLKIAQVVGLNTDQKAAQVISSQREGDNTFLAILEIECDDAFTKGRQVLSELEDFYFETEGSAAERLNATFKEAGNKLSPENGFDLCLAAISGKALYLIGAGQVEVYLKREDKLLPLLSVGAPSQLISGFTSAGDRLLFSTKTLVTFLGEELEKTLSLPIELFEEEVGSKIGASDLEDKGLAGLVVEVEDETLEITPLEEQNTEPASSESFDYPQKRLPAIIPIILSKGVGLFKLGKMYFPKSGRGRLIVAVILIIIIALGVGYKYISGRDKEKQLQFTQSMQESRDALSSAKGIATLNPAEAKRKLDLAKERVNKALSLKPNDKEAQSFKVQLEQESSSILQESSVANFPVFLDLDLVKKNFRATAMSMSGNKLLILDPGVKTLISVDLTKKSNQILGGAESLGEASLASLNGELAFIYSGDKGILRVDTTNSKLSSVSKKDEGWGKIVDIYGFGGNIYALDSVKKDTPQSGQIWKYLPTSEGYSDKREYLTKGTSVDFGSAIKLQIESSVYVLKSGGEILRFTRGDKDNFSLGGLDKRVKDPKSFFVSSDTDNLYLLDSGNFRLLILTKTGEYKGQMGGDKFGTATDLAVDEKGKKVYLLEGSKIYSADLK